MTASPRGSTFFTRPYGERLAALLLPADDPRPGKPVTLVPAAEREAIVARLPTRQRAWLADQAFMASAGAVLPLPGAGGAVGGAVLGLGGDASNGATANRGPGLLTGALAAALPAGTYRLRGRLADADLACLGWLLGAYEFDRYKPSNGLIRALKAPERANRARVLAQAEAVWRARDLINTPANDCGPDEIATAVEAVGERFGAKVKTTRGTELLSGYPLIHAVGRASTRPPVLIRLDWAPKGKKAEIAALPHVALVGKGICFDTGGLDIKPASAMLLMKKDMAGAATALAAAEMIMAAGLPVRLSLLIPAAENAISGDAFRPGDVLPSRAGLSVEIGNTDAEGRLVLADALAEIDAEAPDYVFSFATLTGAARVALGPDLPAMFTSDDRLAADLAAAGTRIDDPLWRLPLWPGYDGWLMSKIADLNHIAAGDSPFAGATVAALFLKRFVSKARSFAHFDLYGWTPRARPGRPEGAEPQTARAVVAYLERRLSP